MNITTRQQSHVTSASKTSIRKRNNDNDDNSNSEQQQQQQETTTFQQRPTWQGVSASRLPLATSADLIDKRTTITTANDINNNNNNNANINSSVSVTISSLEFVNDATQKLLVDKICWTCDNCHSVPFYLWRSIESSHTINNDNTINRPVRQRHHTASNNSTGKSSILGEQTSSEALDSEYYHHCRHKLCSKCLDQQQQRANGQIAPITTTTTSPPAFHSELFRDYNELQSSNNPIKCPYDDQPMQSRQIVHLELEGEAEPTTTLARELVYCVNKSQGCKKSMPINDLQAHTKDCLYARAQCPLNCGENLTVKSLAMGHLTTCPRRPINCDYCDEEIALNALADHKKVCPKRPVSCHYCHSDNLIQEELEEHYEICDKKSRPCRFNPVCPFTGTKDECSDHAKNWEFHIDLLLRHIINDNMFASKKNRITDIIAIMKDLDSETTSLKSQLDLVTNKLDDMYKQNEEAHELIMELKRENEEIKKRLHTSQAGLTTPSPTGAGDQINDELRLTREKLAKLEAQQKADANVWRALVEVLRKDIEALKVAMPGGNSAKPSSTLAPVEKTIVASLVRPTQLTPIVVQQQQQQLQQQQQQQQSLSGKPPTYPLVSNTIFEEQENEQDNYSPLPTLRDHHHLYGATNNHQQYHHDPMYNQKLTSKKNYLADHYKDPVYTNQSQTNYNNNYGQHHTSSQSGRNQSEV